MSEIETTLKQAFIKAIQEAYSVAMEENEIELSLPKDKAHGDYATNVAMKSSKKLGGKPRDIAETIEKHFDFESANVDHLEIAGPGFINLFMKNDSLQAVITKVLEKKDTYGQSDAGHGKKINIEYVSANPTGDLHPGHARGAAVGDSLSRIMKMAGYHGEDLVHIADNIVREYGDKYADIDPKESYSFFRTYGLKAELDKLKSDLNEYRVEFDVWTSEQDIRNRGLVEKAVETLKEKGYTYENDGALYLRTSELGDDKDRVLIKSDGSYTYFTPDIAYHLDKLDRGFDQLVDLFGADHHGYIPRLKAAIQALGYQNEKLDVDIIQMVRMIKDGEEFKLSKRSGKGIALRDLLEEAGVDAVRYFFVSRAGDTQMDFDLDLATKKSNDNPVYYAQYAHARMCSVLEKGKHIELATKYDLITTEKEMTLLKEMNEFEKTIADAANTRMPHKVVNYITKFAQSFHSYYNDSKILDENNIELSAERLALVQACEITLKNALWSIGVEAKEHM